MLYDEGKLNGVLQPYLKPSGGGYDWWDDDKGRVIWKWIADRLCDPKTCEFRENE